MGKLIVISIGLGGVAVGSLFGWLLQPTTIPEIDVSAEHLAVLRDIQRDIEAIRESVSRLPAYSLLPQESVDAPRTDIQVQPLVTDLQQALAQLVAQASELQEVVAFGALVARDTAELPMNEKAVLETIDRMGQPGEYVLHGLFGLSPSDAYRRFGTPLSVGADNGAVYWRYRVESGGGLSLRFTDGYLSSVLRTQ